MLNGEDSEWCKEEERTKNRYEGNHRALSRIASQYEEANMASYLTLGGEMRGAVEKVSIRGFSTSIVFFWIHVGAEMA